MTERLMDAVLSLRYQQLEALLRRDVAVNTRNRLGQTPVMVACYIPDEEKSYRMFKFLQKRGADVLETDDQRTSVFQHACRQGRERIARKIVRDMGVASADLGGKNCEGRSPLFDAVTSGNVSLVRFIVKLMRERSLGVDMPDNSGITPLIQAHKMGLVDVAAVLEKDGNANPRICDGECHMNATEWAEETARRRLRVQALLRERTREHRMIYSGDLDHHKLSSHRSSVSYPKKSPSLPDIRPRWHSGTYNTKSDTIGGKNWNGDSQRISERNSNSWIVRKSLEISQNTACAPDAPTNSSLVNRSVDTAMTMLELASRTSEKRRFVKNFVSSEFDTSKVAEYGNLRLASVNSLLSMYSSQFSSAFRKPAKPPPEPVPERPVFEKKPSTLAYIMGRGPKPSKDRHNKRRDSHHKSLSRKNSKLKVSSRRGSVSSTDSGAKSNISQGSSGGESSKKLPVGRRQSQDEMPKQVGQSSGSGETSLTGRARRGSETGSKAGDSERVQDTGGESRRRSKTLQPPKLSRVLEDDQGPSHHQSVTQRLNPRDSLPNIRVTVPSV